MDWYLSGQAQLTGFPSSHSASCMPTSPLITFVLSPPHSSWSCMPPSPFSPDATQFVIYTVHCPIRSSSSSIHCSIIFFFPLSSLTSLKIVIFPPSSPSQSVSFISTLATNKTNTLHQKQFHIFFASKHVTTQRKPSPCGLSMYLFPLWWYLSRKMKGIGVLEEEEKDVAI